MNSVVCAKMLYLPGFTSHQLFLFMTFYPSSQVMSGFKKVSWQVGFTWVGSPFSISFNLIRRLRYLQFKLDALG